MTTLPSLPGFMPIRCGACDALAFWLREDVKPGDRERVEDVRHPDGSAVTGGDLKRCLACRVDLGTTDLATRIVQASPVRPTGYTGREE